jgi:ABC-type transport system involved in multi-copper enzyme maturation permease subunit
MLTQPISRTQFLLGKFFGLYATVLVSVAILGCFYFFVVRLFGSGDMSNLTLAVGLVALEGAILTAVAVLFSTVASPFLSAVFTFLVYVAGHLAADLKLLAKHAEAPGLSFVGDVFAVLVPALHAFHVRDNILSGIAIPWERLVWCVAATLLYSAAALVTASLAFARRDFE